MICSLDGLVKSLKRLLSVIPAQAGIQSFRYLELPWIPVFTGMTTFYEFIIIWNLCNHESEKWFFRALQKVDTTVITRYLINSPSLRMGSLTSFISISSP